MKKYKQPALHKRNGFKLFLLSLAAIFILLSVIAINSMKANTDTKAAGNCKYVKVSMNDKGKLIPANGPTACAHLAQTYNTPFKYNGGGNEKGFVSGYRSYAKIVTYYCCVAQKQNPSKIEKGEDCKNLGGDWYRGTDEVLKKSWAKNYTFSIEDATWQVGAYYKKQFEGKRCLKFSKLTAKPECKGEWVKGTCSNPTNSKNKKYVSSGQSSNSLFGYKDGFQCCIKAK